MFIYITCTRAALDINILNYQYNCLFTSAHTCIDIYLLQLSMAS